MIYSIIGTDKLIKDTAIKELQSCGAVSRYLYSEHIGELESFVSGASLFGDVVIVSCVSLMESASSKEELIRLLPSMEVSQTVFIIDEPFADVHKVNRLSKVSKKIYDAREEKKKDSSIFTLCTSFANRDKKSAWLQFMDVKEKESGEAIQGALWWKWRELWQDTLSGRGTKYTKEECERIGKELLEASILAHRGEKDLMTELERIILSI